MGLLPLLTGSSPFLLPDLSNFLGAFHGLFFPFNQNIESFMVKIKKQHVSRKTKKRAFQKRKGEPMVPPFYINKEN